MAVLAMRPVRWTVLPLVAGFTKSFYFLKQKICKIVSEVNALQQARLTHNEIFYALVGGTM